MSTSLRRNSGKVKKIEMEIVVDNNDGIDDEAAIRSKGRDVA